MKKAFTLATMSPDSTTQIPFLYALDILERRYGQPPGSAATWDAEALLRALQFQRLEAQAPARGPRG